MNKEDLDILMVEYDWERNTLDDNIEFIFYMLKSYTGLRKHIGLAKCGKKVKNDH